MKIFWKVDVQFREFLIMELDRFNPGEGTLAKVYPRSKFDRVLGAGRGGASKSQYGPCREETNPLPLPGIKTPIS
jgi:hypothetical protein